MAQTFQKITTVAGNTAPPLSFFAKRNGSAIPMTSVSDVQLYIVDKLKNGSQTNAGHEECDIVDSDTGELSYVREADDIASAGVYYADLLVNYVDGTNEVLTDILQIIARDRLVVGEV